MKLPGILFCLPVLLSQAACGNVEPLKIEHHNPGRQPYVTAAYSETLSARAREKFGHGQCALQFSGIEDARRYKDGLGSVAGRPVHIAGLDKRLNDYLVSHLASSTWISVVKPESPPVDAIVLRGELLKAHIGSSSTSMVTNIAIRMSFEFPGEAPRQVLLRGKNIRLNWDSGDEEIQDSINAAIVDLVHKTRGIILPRCQQLAAQG